MIKYIILRLLWLTIRVSWINVYFAHTAKIISFSKFFISCFSLLAQGSASNLPYH